MDSQTNNISSFSSFINTLHERFSIPKILLSLFLILMGIIVLILMMGMEDQTSSNSMLLIVLGTVLLLVGLFRLFWRSRHVVYLPTNSPVRRLSLHFMADDENLLSVAVNDGISNIQKTLKTNPNGNLLLEVVLSEDKQFVAVQLSKFSSYTYRPITEVHCYEGKCAERFICFIKSCLK